MRKMIPFVLPALLVAAAMFQACAHKQPPGAAPPPDVDVAHVIVRDVPVYFDVVGQTRGSQEVDVRARISGILETVNFQEGRFVRRGQLLYTIDPREYVADVEGAKSNVAQAQANLARYDQDVARYRPLVEQNALPRQQLETAVAQATAGRAAVDSARAALTRAELDLSYTKVLAPTDGIIGKTEVNQGNLVGRGESTLLTRISKIDPIHARISISEREYLQIARQFMASGRRATEGEPFELTLADGTVQPHGRLVFADRLVDPNTGTLLLDVAFPNPDHLIRPGQYARVRITTDVKRGALLVPQKAISSLQDVYTVYVVTPDNKVTTKPVRPGTRFGALWAIDSGLAKSDLVIVEGGQKVRAGMVVKPTLVEVHEEPATASPATAPAGGAPSGS